MARRRKFSVLSGIILLSLLAAAMPLASGCAPETAVEKEKVVTYLSLADLTGPTGAMRVYADKLSQWYVEDLNEAGGVDGVKINYIVVDTRYDTSRAVAAYKRYRTEPNLLYAQPNGTDALRVLASQWEKDGIVGYAAPDGYFQAHQGPVFLWGPCYQDMFSSMLDWVVADWKAKGKPGMPKLAHMGWDNAWGREVLHGGVEYAEKLGLTMVESEFYPTGTLKHDVYLTRMAAAGANYIHVGGVDPAPSNVIRDAHALGLTKDIQFISDYWGTSEAIGIKAHPEALEGTVVLGYFLRGEDAWQHPLCEILEKYVDKPLRDLPDAGPIAMDWIIRFESGVRQALKNVSYEELDGEDMFQGLKELTGMDLNQGFTGPCTWSETERRGSRLVNFYQVKGGHVVRIQDWVEAPDAVSLHKW